jgi:hypothetical protein
MTQNSRLTFFSFNALNISLHTLLVCIASEEKLDAILIFYCFTGKIFFLFLLRCFLLSLIFLKPVYDMAKSNCLSFCLFCLYPLMF